MGLAQKTLNQKTTRAVVFVSGDVHYAELMAKRMPKSSQFGAAQVRKWVNVTSIKVLSTKIPFQTIYLDVIAAVGTVMNIVKK